MDTLYWVCQKEIPHRAMAGGSSILRALAVTSVTPGGSSMLDR